MAVATTLSNVDYLESTQLCDLAGRGSCLSNHVVITNFKRPPPCHKMPRNRSALSHAFASDTRVDPYLLNFIIIR